MSRLYTIGRGGGSGGPGPVRLAPIASSSPIASGRTRLVDSFGRQLTYLRVSVTDRCNLRCTYCLPEDAEFEFGDRDLLSPEEIESLVGALVRLGIERVRLTGGEPLVRTDILDIARRIKALPGVRDLALSTNGTELERLAPALRAAGIDRVNVSLDSLDAERFREITRRGDLAKVWRGVEAALAAGLAPVKLNAVLASEESLEEVERLAALTVERPLAVRFIEMMPTATNRHPGVDRVPTCDEARALIEARYGALEPVSWAARTGPAQAFRIAGSRGSVGFITPLSHTFCADCNRLRLTARGELRLCLFDERNHPLRPLLQEPDAPAALEEEILRVLRQKPEEHLLRRGDYGNLASFMQIGG